MLARFLRGLHITSNICLYGLAQESLSEHGFIDDPYILAVFKPNHRHQGGTTESNAKDVA